MSQKQREESAKLFNPTPLQVNRESEHCLSGIESKVGPDQWVCLWPEEIDRHRDTLCKQYEQCLDYAATRQWEGFSCAECPNFLKEKE